MRKEAELDELRRLLRLGEFPSSGGGGGGGLTNEQVDDRVAALLQAGANITLTYNDVANTLTIASSGGGATGYFPGGWS